MPVKKHIPRHASTTHQGWILSHLPYLEGTALVLCGTLGAGILGIPFVVSQVGVGLGLICIALVGLLVLGLNILIAEIACATRRPLQLVGLAREYLGPTGEIIMLVIMYSMMFGSLLIYLIGEGDTLSILFGGDPARWALVFFLLATGLVVVGMRTVKTVEMILVVAILSVIAVIAGVGVPHIHIANLSSIAPRNMLVLYSVLVFAFHATTAIPEAHSVLSKKIQTFKRSVVTSSLICIVLYALFSLVVVGITGGETSAIATIGLGYKVGPSVRFLGNIFAALVMATGFLMAASSLRDSLKWDFKFLHIPAALLACTIPATMYFLGIRQFIVVMDVVGGVFVSLEMLMMIVIYWRARQLGKIRPKKEYLHHALFASGFLFVALFVGTVYTIARYF